MLGAAFQSALLAASLLSLLPAAAAQGDKDPAVHLAMPCFHGSVTTGIDDPRHVDYVEPEGEVDPSLTDDTTVDPAMDPALEDDFIEKRATPTQAHRPVKNPVVSATPGKNSTMPAAGNMTETEAGPKKEFMDANGCGFCNMTKGIEFKPWFNATEVTNFEMPGAGGDAAAGDKRGGYHVWWSIPQPGKGCRNLISVPFDTVDESVTEGVRGNVIISARNAGCYFSQVGVRGVQVGFCCGDGDCKKAGAMPLTKAAKRQAQVEEQDIEKIKVKPMSRVKRSMDTSSGLSKRILGLPDPPKKEPLIVCKDEKPVGDKIRKAGPQLVSGTSVPCGGGATCNVDTSVTFTLSKSISTDESVTLTTSKGKQVSVTAGMQMMSMGPIPIGPSITYGETWTEDESKAVANSLGISDSDSTATAVSFSFSLIPGPTYLTWFTPTMECQGYTKMCNDKEVKTEVCSPLIEDNEKKFPVGSRGVMVTG